MQTVLATNGSPLPAPRPGEEGWSGDTKPGLGVIRRLAKDEELFAEGDEAAFFYKVTSGALRTCRLLDDGRRQIDAFHLPGDLFGIEAGGEHRHTAEAVGDATVVAYRCGPHELASGEGPHARAVVASVLRALERAQDHILLLGRTSALERIASFLLDLAERLPGDGTIDLPMSRTDIADHLGLTIETVSRSLTQLKRLGVIDLPVHSRTITLRDPAALRRLEA